MGAILPFPRQKPLNEAWNHYAALVRASQRDPDLAADRDHIEATWRAYRRFGELFSASQGAA
jgi:hypothetical protein